VEDRDPGAWLAGSVDATYNAGPPRNVDHEVSATVHVTTNLSASTIFRGIVAR
jgi:hypothetical protein